MVRIERDPGFWQAVAAHPEVAPRLGGAVTADGIAGFVGREDVLPLAAVHGGFLFVKRDPLGFTAELHTLFTPEGWGREVLEAAVQAFNAVFHIGHQLVFTFETATNPKSRPPLSFGFRQGGDWRDTPYGRMRQWVLTADAWRASPASTRRREKCH
ncbi:MAG TPA: hypothetical protein VGI30_07830 [Caulobacteraceae bacterium]|jgi:hypothetical protein